MRVCVYCGSSSGEDPRFVAAATTFATALARAGIGVVYGGGRIGLMGAVADAALAAGGEVIGIIPRFLEEREVAHGGVDLRVVGSMHERKALMAELSDAFVAMPGGLGTLEEFFEVWTWGQLGLHRKPYALLNVDGFYDPLVSFIDGLVTQRFVKAEHRAMLIVESDVEKLPARLAAHRTPAVETWIDRAAT
jgi:hypothetical protein